MARRTRLTSPRATRTSSGPFWSRTRRAAGCTGGRAASGRGKGRAVPGGNKDTAEIRKWARENGHSVNDRGRVPAEIREAYEKANG